MSPPRWFAGILLLLCAACASAPPPVRPPRALQLHVECYLGAALTGEVADALLPVEAAAAAPGIAQQPPWLHAEVREVPAPAGEPLALHAALVVDTAAAAPFGAFPRRLAAVSVGTGTDAVPGADEPLATASSPLPDGTTTVLELRTGAGAATGLPRLLCDRQGRDTLRVALAIDSELVVLASAPAPDGAPLDLFLPDSFLPDGDGSAVRVRLALGPPPAGVDDAAARRQQAQAQEAAARAAAATRAPDAAALESAAQARQLHALVYVEDRRFALFAIADAAHAEICLDFLLCADAPALGRLLDALAPGLPAPDTRAFALDRESLCALLPPLQRGELAPAQFAFLLRACGAAGRNAATLQAVLERVTSADDLRAQLIAENLDILHESDAAARVFAFDWLLRAGRAPAGFDPLADRQARARALEAAATSGTRPAEGR